MIPPADVIADLAATLAHFLWQGAVIAAVLALALRTARSARSRHDLAAAALVLAALAPLATFLWLRTEAPVVVVFAPPGAEIEPPLTWQIPAVALWLAGVLVLAVRAAGGLLVIARLRREAAPLPADWLRRCEDLRRRMGAPAVAFMQSLRIEAPAVAGWLKPVVLLPASALTGMPTAHLEALVLHELAHVRRRDAIINLIQVGIETVLFYHPAVWWIGRQIRKERENCCDDLAVAATGDAGAYVRALEAMASLRAGPALALSARGGSLAARARRLLNASPAADRAPLPRLAAGFALVAALLLTGQGGGVEAAQQAQPASPPRPAASQAPVSPPAKVEQVRYSSARASLAPAPTTVSTPAAAPTYPGDLGPMPPETEPQARADWRIAYYDRWIQVYGDQIASNRRNYDQNREIIERQNSTQGDAQLAVRKAYVEAQGQITFQRIALTETLVKAATEAKAATLALEAARWEGASGTRRERAAADLERAESAFREAFSQMTARQRDLSQALSRLSRENDRNTREAVAADARAAIERSRLDLNDRAAASQANVLRDALARLDQRRPEMEANERASLASAALSPAQDRMREASNAYRILRDDVERGLRPEADLRASAENLKAAQEAYWDAQDLANAAQEAFADAMFETSSARYEQRIIDPNRQAAAQAAWDRQGATLRSQLADRMRMLDAVQNGPNPGGPEVIAHVKTDVDRLRAEIQNRGLQPPTVPIPDYLRPPQRMPTLARPKRPEVLPVLPGPGRYPPNQTVPGSPSLPYPPQTQPARAPLQPLAVPPPR